MYVLQYNIAKTTNLFIASHMCGFICPYKHYIHKYFHNAYNVAIFYLLMKYSNYASYNYANANLITFYRVCVSTRHFLGGVFVYNGRGAGLHSCFGRVCVCVTVLLQN